MRSSRTASTGFRSSPSTLESTVTPTIAPNEPGIASWSTSRWSMLRKRQCEIAAAIPVATFARFTVVDTPAGDSPVLSRMLDEVGPKPIPSAPSTSDAANPATATMTSSSALTGEAYRAGEVSPARSGLHARPQHHLMPRGVAIQPMDEHC